MVVLGCLKENGVRTLCIGTGQPVAERFRGKPPRKLSGRIPEPVTAPHPDRSPGGHRGLPSGVQPPQAAQPVGLSEPGGLRQESPSIPGSGRAPPSVHRGWTFRSEPTTIYQRLKLSLPLEQFRRPGQWFIAFRGMTNVMTKSRNAIFTALPRIAIGNSAPVCLLRESSLGFAFFAAADSFVFDYITRQKFAGGKLSFFVVEQLPMLPPATYAEPCARAGQPAVTFRDWLLPRVLELTYTAWDLEPFARDCGWFGPPFVWDEARRFQLRCELDAAFLHLYGLSRADAAYILDTFPIVRRKDEAAHGTYRTRDTILALYDHLSEASATGKAFTSPLDPPPGDIRACHPFRVPE
jgi:hypothetical protein